MNKKPICKCLIHVLTLPKGDEVKVLVEKGTGDIILVYSTHEHCVSRQLQDEEREKGRAMAAGK